jgi:hypothetical protein
MTREYGPSMEVTRLRVVTRHKVRRTKKGRVLPVVQCC